MFSILSKIYLEKKLINTPYKVEVKNTVTSTNTIMKERVLSEDCTWHVLLAAKQIAGRGRMGRTFYSPSQSGVYMSIAIKIEDGENPLLITTDAAVCAARVLEKMSGKSAFIKWVNDIYIENRKVCGILTEGAGKYAVLGIGINVFSPECGFPDDIKDRAGAVFEKKRAYIREDVVVEFLCEFAKIYKKEDRSKLLSEYRNRSMITGKEITILNTGEKAQAIEISDDYSLIVRNENGEIRKLSSGDVSIKI